MTDEGALEYILETTDDFIKIFDEIPVDSAEHMAKYAIKHIVAAVKALSTSPSLSDDIVKYATAIAGLVIKIKVGSHASALLAAEEVSDEST